MADSPRSRRSRRSFTPDRSSASPAPSTRSSQSRRLVSSSLQRPLSTASQEEQLRPPRLQHAESRFSLNENFAASRREYDFEGDDYSFSESASLFPTGDGAVDRDHDDEEDVTFDESRDLYNLLGLSREANPTTAQITTAYEWHRTSLAMHREQQPPSLKEVVRKHCARLRYAYETLVHPHRRAIYDLLGENGLRREYSEGGIMGKGGEAERDFLVVEALSGEEFIRWFQQVLKIRALRRKRLLGSRGTWVLESHPGLTMKNGFGFKAFSGPNSILRSHQPAYLAVHQDFGIPLKRLRRLFPSSQTTLEPDINDRSQSGNYSLNCLENDDFEGPVLTVVGGITSVDGKTEHTQSGQRNTPFMPNCALQLHHTFSRNASRSDELLNSLLGDTSVDVTTNLWPQQRCFLGLGRQLAILDRTRPFHCYLRTAFQSNAMAKFPEIALRVERPVSDNAFLYYQIRSSNASGLWQTLYSTTRSYFRIPFFNTEPNTDIVLIGYCWAGSRLNRERHQGINGYIRPELITHNETSFDQLWQVGFMATTLSLSFSTKYVYHMFSGESITSSNENRGVKIETAGWADENLNFTGLIRAVRKVGRSTLGIGVALNSGEGLFVICSVGRWGQDLNLPVLIVPYDSEWAWLAFGVPSAICVLIEFAILRPGRRRKRRAMEKRELPDLQIETGDPK